MGIKMYIPLVWILTSCIASAQADIDFAYLGVHTSRLDGGTSHQLGLPPRAHLRVDRVVPGSPAEGGGVQLYDILLKLDDQLLINPDQLKTLVRMRNPGERISLSIIRKAKPISLSVELVEAPESVRNSHDREWFEDGDSIDFDNRLGPNDRLRELWRRHSMDFPNLRDFYRRPLFSDPLLDGPPISTPQTPGGQDDPLHGTGADVHSYSFSSSTKQVTVSDKEGTLQWTEKDGLRFLRATDLEGGVLFEGAITSQEDRKNMPDSVKMRLQTLQKTGQIPAN